MAFKLAEHLNKLTKYTFFWQNASPFSQWHRAYFREGQLTYTCAEQYMMYHKALLFGDQAIALKIMQAGYNPKEHKRLGRLVKNFDNTVWNENARSIVYNGSKLKFEQNNKLLDVLLTTKGTMLVEASPYDDIWGIKMGPDDPKRFDRSKWRGTNWLGQVLTQLRYDLGGE